MSSDLYDYPELYDALLPATGHISYYVDLAKRASGDVLELACGTGQLTLPIAKAGARIVGARFVGTNAADREGARGV